MRKVIAAKLTESKTTVPHYYLSVNIDLEKAQELRAVFNGQLEASGKKLSINDFVLKASALAMKKVPEANSSWQGSSIRQYHNVNINVAISVENGLVSPVLRTVESLGNYCDSLSLQSSSRVLIVVAFVQAWLIFHMEFGTLLPELLTTNWVHYCHCDYMYRFFLSLTVAHSLSTFV